MNGFCEVSWDSSCTGRAQHTHHRKLRSQGGSDGPENTLRCCAICHQLLHLHPAESYSLGFLVHGWDDPASITFRRRLEVA